MLKDCFYIRWNKK